MCFSFEVSLITFITSWSIAIFLLQQELEKIEYHYVIFLMIFSSMQLIDAIFWYNKNKKNNLNYYLTSIAIPIILSAQVFYNIIIINEITNIYILSFLCIYTVYLFFKFNGYTEILCDNKYNSPIWGTNEIKLPELIIFVILTIYPQYYAIIGWILLFIIMVESKLISGYGSLWCAIANIYAFVLLYKYYIFKKM